jgi:periplasmic protein TonB
MQSLRALIILSGLFFLFSCTVHSQPIARPHEVEIPQYRIHDSDTLYTLVEEMPVFPGGDQKMFEFISTNIHYPSMELTEPIKGSVYAEFVVNEDGKISGVKSARGYGDTVDNVVLDAIRKMPDWTAGKQKGRNVKVRMIIPLSIHVK